MQNFADLGLSEAALAAVERLGYENPTPVQLQAIPLVLEGRDLIAAASTGTGKTAAFLLPILSTLPRGKRGKRAPRVLVVSPTRELAQQISQTCMQITRKTGHYVTTVFGGTPYGPQINEIRRGTDVLIATPGRLNDLMNETAQTVEQFMMPIANFKKPELLQALLEEKGSDRVIVFARTKNRTEDCAEALCDAGYRAESIHSDKSQGQRKRALDNFRRGRTSILVATDVLARGIDVPDVDHVINFDLPDMPEDYVHRIGRTGRAGEQGFAVSFVTRESRRTMSDIEKLIGKNVPLMELETYELDMTVLEKGKKGAPKKGGYKGNKGSGRPAGAKRSDKRGGEKRDFERRSDSRAEGRSDNRPGRGKRAEGKRSFDGAAKPDGPRSNNMDHAKRRLEMSEKKKYEKSAPNAKGAAKQNGSKKKAGVGGYNYSRFANN